MSLLFFLVTNSILLFAAYEFFSLICWCRKRFSYALFSVCRSCLLKHLKVSKTCPVCGNDLGSKLGKAIGRDLFLQRLVYKIVPDMYWKEVMQRTEYLRKRVISEEEIAFLLDNVIIFQWLFSYFILVTKLDISSAFIVFYCKIFLGMSSDFFL